MSEPLSTATYTLTRADALAYEQAAARFTPLGMLALVLWLGACASIAFMLPADWAGPLLDWSFSILVSLLAAIGYVLALILISFRQWLAARHRQPRPQEITVVEWPDRFEITGPSLPPSLPIRDIRESILARAHLFLVSDTGVLILPRTAYEEEDTIDFIAARIAGRPLPAKVDAAPSRA